MKNGHILAFRKIRSEAGRVFLHWPRGEADQIIDDNLYRAADGVSLQVREVQRFGKNSLASESRVSMHNDRNDFVAVEFRFAACIAREFCASAADGDGIYGFKVTRIGYEVDTNFFSMRSEERSSCANVIFNIASAEDAAGIDVFKTGDNFMRSLARGVDHDVEAAAVAHGHDGFDCAVLARGIENGIEQGNEGGNAFQRKTFGAEITRLKNLFKQIGANEARENYVAIGFRRRGFHAFGNPAATLWLEEVHEVGANRTGVDLASGIRIAPGKSEVRGF